MRKHGGTPSRRDNHVTPAAISPPGDARGRFVGGQQSGVAGCKPPPLLTRGASSCSSQGRRQGEPRGASPRPSAPTYLPTYLRKICSLWYNLTKKIVFLTVAGFGILGPHKILGVPLSLANPGSTWYSTALPAFPPMPFATRKLIRRERGGLDDDRPLCLGEDWGACFNDFRTTGGVSPVCPMFLV